MTMDRADTQEIPHDDKESNPLDANKVYQALKNTSSVEEFLKQGYLRRNDGQGVMIEGHGMENDVADLFNPNSFLHTLVSMGGRHAIERVGVFDRIKGESIKDKRVLVVPAYGENAFMFSALGAKEVVGVDLDQLTIDWMNLLREFFNTNHIGEILLSRLSFPDMDARTRLKDQGIIQPPQQYKGQFLIEKLFSTIHAGESPNPLPNVAFQRASLGRSSSTSSIGEVFGRNGQEFDFIHVPYLLGIDSGIETTDGISDAFEDLYQVCAPGARVMIAPLDASEGLAELFSKNGSLSHVRGLIPKEKFEIDYETNVGDAGIGLLRAKK